MMIELELCRHGLGISGFYITPSDRFNILHYIYRFGYYLEYLWFQMRQKKLDG